MLRLVPLVLLLAAAAGCSSSGNGSAPRTVDHTVTVSSTPSGASSTASIVPSSSAAGTSEAVGASSFTMPNEVGRNLQDAQDDVQAVSGNPLFFTRSTDATGAGRHQILDRDWKVCSQNVPAGTSVGAEADIVFSVVKLTERC